MMQHIALFCLKVVSHDSFWANRRSRGFSVLWWAAVESQLHYVIGARTSPDCTVQHGEDERGELWERTPPSRPFCHNSQNEHLPRRFCGLRFCQQNEADKKWKTGL